MEGSYFVSSVNKISSKDKTVIKLSKLNHVDQSGILTGVQWCTVDQLHGQCENGPMND